MPVKVFGSPYLATYVQNNAASFGITEPIETTTFKYFRGGRIDAPASGGYQKDWLSTSLPASQRTWGQGFYAQRYVYDNSVVDESFPNCVQDNDAFSGANGYLSGTDKRLQVGFPGLAGTDDFIPIDAQIDYVRYWITARGWQIRTRGTNIGTGGSACPDCDPCPDTRNSVCTENWTQDKCNPDPPCPQGDDRGTSQTDNIGCWYTPRGYLQGQRVSGGPTLNGSLFPHIQPIGHDNLTATAESTEVTTSQKADVTTWMRGVDPETDALRDGFVVRWDTTQGIPLENRYANWKAGTLSGAPLADRYYHPDRDYVMRSEAFTQNPFGASGIPWNANYAQWCAFGIKLRIGNTGNCQGIMISDFAIEIGYTEKAFVVNSRCGEAQPTADGALVKGYFETSGLPADWRFEYGMNPSALGSATPWTLFQFGPQSVSTLLTGLATGTWYYRLVLRDANLALTYGDICTFDTATNCEVRPVLVM
jgi:hypothetical protein